MVELEGVIVSPIQVVTQLKKFADDDSIKAIILHVNSPGGGVAASEEIYREVKRIRDDKKKRIVASIEHGGSKRRVLCFFRDQQDLCRQWQRGRLHRRDRRMGELWRPACAGPN